MRAQAAKNRRALERAALFAALLLFSASAYAQDQSGPFRFLKPWLEREIFGKEAPETEAPAERETAAPPPADAPATNGPAATAAVPESAPEAPPLDVGEASTLPSGGETAATPPAPDASPPAADSAAVETGVPGAEPAIPPVAEPKPVPLRFAVLAGRSVAGTMALIGPIADDLGELLGRPVEFLPFPSYTAMIDAQSERRIDGGFFSAAAFAFAEARCDCLEPLVAPRAFDGTLAYHAIIVARADSSIRSTADLQGKTVAIGAEDSLGARRMQLAGLMAEGLDPATTFASVVETASAEVAVRLVASRSADAAFAWSSLAGSVETGYSRGTLTDLVAAGVIAAPDLAIVWQSPAIEHGPFAVMRTLDAADKEKIEAYLVALMTSNPAAYDGLNPHYGGGYAPVDARDYAGLEVLAAQDVDALKLTRAQQAAPVLEVPPPAVPPAAN